MSKVKKKSLFKFKMINMRVVQTYFGIQLKYSKSAIIFHQRKYINIVLDRFEIIDYNLSKIFINKGFKLQKYIENKLIGKNEY